MNHYQIINTWDEERNHEYDIYTEITNEGVVYKMYASNSERWAEHYRGKLLLSIIDDGNEYKFSRKLPQKMDYNAGSELYVLLSFINSIEKSIFKGEIVEVHKISEI